uniref:Uncharacterized protein n=1 Tax=Anguilla anguilla TaxID=7936 RepID=A0A0E9TZR6_ANGAN
MILDDSSLSNIKSKNRDYVVFREKNNSRLADECI